MYGTVSARMYFCGCTMRLRYDNITTSRKCGAPIPLQHFIINTAKTLLTDYLNVKTVSYLTAVGIMNLDTHNKSNL